MSKRLPKASGPSQSSKNTRVVDDGQDDHDTLQDLAAQQRQQESDYDDAPDGSDSQTLREQVQTLARNQSHTETLLEQLLTKITEISNPQANPLPQERRPLTPTRERAIGTPASVATDQTPGQRYSKKLPDPVSLSDGTDPTFLSWKLQIQGKFRCNSDHYQDEEDKMFYLFNRTSGDAQQHLQPRYDEDSQTRFTSAKEMLDYLASIYVNPNAVRDARHDYNSLTMKPSQSFAEFQTQFLHLAGQAQVSRESLRLDLYDRVTTPLQKGIAPLLRLLPTYGELAADLASLDAELRRITVREERQKRFRERQPARTHFTANAGPAPTTAVTPKPTTASHSLFVRAKSETPRTEPRRPAPADAVFTCFNCDKPGHIAKECPEPRRGDLKEIEEELEESYDDDQDEDSGKEEP
jgi:hypothetical protein